MSKEMTVIALGLFVAVVPYIGIPSSWKTPLLLVVGILIILMGFLLRGSALSRGTEGSESRPYVENTTKNKRDHSLPEELE